MKHRRPLILATLAISVSHSPGLGAEARPDVKGTGHTPETYALKARASDWSGRRPVPLAEVEVVLTEYNGWGKFEPIVAKVKSDKTGRVTFTGLKPRKYHIVATAEGMQPHDSYHDLGRRGQAEVKEWDIVMIPAFSATCAPPNTPRSMVEGPPHSPKKIVAWVQIKQTPANVRFTGLSAGSWLARWIDFDTGELVKIADFYVHRYRPATVTYDRPGHCILYLKCMEEVLRDLRKDLGIAESSDREAWRDHKLHWAYAQELDKRKWYALAGSCYGAAKYAARYHKDQKMAHEALVREIDCRVRVGDLARAETLVFNRLRLYGSGTTLLPNGLPQGIQEHLDCYTKAAEIAETVGDASRTRQRYRDLWRYLQKLDLAKLPSEWQEKLANQRDWELPPLVEKWTEKERQARRKIAEASRQKSAVTSSQ